MVTGERANGTADDAAARDSDTASRSEQKDVEYALSESDPYAGGDVGCRRDDKGAIAAVEIAECRTVEEDFVV